MAKQFDTDKIFTYHPPFGSQQARYEALRDKAKEFANLMQACAPPSRELSTALSKVQEATMWVNAAIAINETAPAVSTEPQPNEAPVDVLEGEVVNAG